MKSSSTVETKFKTAGISRMQTAQGIFNGLRQPHDDHSVKILTICSERKDNFDDDDVDEDEIFGAKTRRTPTYTNPQAAPTGLRTMTLT